MYASIAFRKWVSPPALLARARRKKNSQKNNQPLEQKIDLENSKNN